MTADLLHPSEKPATDDPAYFGPCAKCRSSHGGWESCSNGPLTPEEARAIIDSLFDDDVTGDEGHAAFARGFAKLRRIANAV